MIEKRIWRPTRYTQKIGPDDILWLLRNAAFTTGNTEKLHFVKFGSMLAARIQFERYRKALQFLASASQPRPGWISVNPNVTTSLVPTSSTSNALNATNMGTYYQYTFSSTGDSVTSNATRHNRSGEFEYFDVPSLTVTNELCLIKF